MKPLAMFSPSISRSRAGGAAARVSRAAGMAAMVMVLMVAFVFLTGKSPSGSSAAGLAQSKLSMAGPPQARRSAAKLLARGGIEFTKLQEEGAEGGGGPVEGGGEGAGEGGEAHEAHEGSEHEREGGEEEVEGEEEHEFTAEEAEVITRWGYAFVTIIIAFSVAFEYGVEAIKERVPEELEEVVSALLEELTTLGFLGFAFFMTTVPIKDGDSLIEMASMYSLHEKEALKELFEGLHYLVFFVSLSFIFSTIGGLLTFRFTGDKHWGMFEEYGVKAFQNPALLEIPHMAHNSEGSLWAEWYKPLEVSQAEYLRIRTRFISESSEPKLEPDFPFHEYLRKRIAEVFSGMIKITAIDWLVTWLVITLFFGVVQEGVTNERLLALYWFMLFMITASCLLLQAKIVWIKMQLIPRTPAEMQSSLRKSSKLVLDPVYKDQLTIGKDSVLLPSWLPSAVRSFVKEHLHLRPGNKHERLFWLDSLGPEAFSHLIRLAMFFVIISLAILLSHHMPGIVHLGVKYFNSRIIGWILYGTLVCFHLVAISVVYVTARLFTLCSSIEMLTDKELVEHVVRDQKFAKCQKAIDMLFMLNFYMQQAQSLANIDTAGGENSGAVEFVAKTEEEAKALEELTELFHHFDVDGSGELSSEEVGALLATMGTNLDEKDLENLVRVMDKDGSGEISLDELATVMLSRDKMSKETKLTDVAEQLFDMFDPDNSGEISLDEMLQVFSTTGKNWDMQDVRDFFELIDTDGGGTVDKQEFLDFIADVEAMSK